MPKAEGFVRNPKPGETSSPPAGWSIPVWGIVEVMGAMADGGISVKPAGAAPLDASGYYCQQPLGVSCLLNQPSLFQQTPSIGAVFYNLNNTFMYIIFFDISHNPVKFLLRLGIIK